MNKTIATAAIAGVAILSPVAAMSVTPVRDALLGLAPEEQIVTLADEIDKSRVENEQKLATLEQELASAKQVIAEQKDALEAQKADHAVKATEQAVLSAKIDKQALCSSKLEENKECSFKEYRNKSDFDEMMATYKAMDSENGNTKIYDRNLKEKKPIFDKCQEIIKSCN
jgi:vacuolar-type H+-ATPase subunit I/STV1